MRRHRSHAIHVVILLSFICMLNAQDAASHTVQDKSPHAMRMINVENDIALEVLDWGGTGRPLVLLAGKGFTAHVFDQFAPTLIAKYHVYAITRRGYGNSSVPPPTDANYSADRLGDDVLAVVEQLKLVRPVLVGHSIAGEELSSIGMRTPDRVAGLVYLEAGYAYSFYDASKGDLTIDYNTLRRQLDGFTALVPMKERKDLLADIVATMPRFEKDLAPYQARFAAAPNSAPAPADTAANRVDVAIFRGEQKFGGVKCPILALYADPHSFGDQFKDHPEALKAAQDKDRSETSAQADAFSRGNPQAVVVRIPNADHFIFESNGTETRKALDGFIDTLPQ
jgi:non-heme chloroperoxidase